jgi:CheY-like chemotaxis protein
MQPSSSLQSQTLMRASPPLIETDRILLVDDEIHLTNLWRLILESTGRYTVREENRGSRVLPTARKFRPHLIFMDRHLSDADGGEVAAELRADAELGSVPIIFVTGSVTQDEAALQSLFGGTPTLAKPFGSEALPRLAKSILDRHRRPLLAA